ncbi:DUF1688 family protein [Pseudomonas marginalis]
MPFRKLTQWLTYSLVEPFEEAARLMSEDHERSR